MVAGYLAVLSGRARDWDRVPVSTKTMRAIAAAAGNSARTSAQPIPPRAGAGSPCGRAPVTFKRSWSPSRATAMQDTTTAMSTPGTFHFSQRGTQMSASETRPSSSAVKLVSPASTFGTAAKSFSQGVLAFHGDPQEGGKLGHSHQQGDAVEIAEPDGLRQQSSDDSQPQHRTEQQDAANQDGQQARQGHGFLLVIRGQGNQGCNDHRGERGIRPQHQHTRWARRLRRQSGALPSRRGRSPVEGRRPGRTPCPRGPGSRRARRRPPGRGAATRSCSRAGLAGPPEWSLSGSAHASDHVPSSGCPPSVPDSQPVIEVRPGRPSPTREPQDAA